jgi:hypothetical protein
MSQSFHQSSSVMMLTQTGEKLLTIVNVCSGVLFHFSSFSLTILRFIIRIQIFEVKTCTRLDFWQIKLQKAGFDLAKRFETEGGIKVGKFKLGQQ